MALTVRDIPDADAGNEDARWIGIVNEALTPDHQ
jgi:hypothetical protein